MVFDLGSGGSEVKGGEIFVRKSPRNREIDFGFVCVACVRACVRAKLCETICG